MAAERRVIPRQQEPTTEGNAMDPNTTLAQLIDAAVQGDHRTMLREAKDLQDWLRKGGFPPADPRR
jgi:hypothetical protein